MNMNDLMKRLSDLDINPVSEAANPASKLTKSVKQEDGVNGAHGEETISPIHGESMNEDDLSLESLRYLSGVNKNLAECGMEMMSPMGERQKPPATFSINASAESGDEVANMLKNIMTLAGVQPVSPSQMPEEPHATMSVIDGEPDEQDVELQAPGSEPSMHDMMAMFDEPEGEDDTMNQEELGAEPEMIGDEVGGDGAHVNAMADEVRNMAAQLASTDKEELGLDDEDTDEGAEDRPYVNSPEEEIGQDGVEQFGDINNNFQNSLVGQNKKTTESIANDLFADYQKFVSESADFNPMGTPRNLPAGPALAAPSRDDMLMQLRKLESEFDPHYQFSDDHSFWKRQDAIKDQINTLKHRLAKSVTEGAMDAIKSGAKKVGGALKTGAKAVGKAIVGPGDEELLRDLQKKAGVPAHAQHGKANMAKSNDVAEGKKPSAGMTTKEKSAVAKKASAGKDIGKPGKGFAKVAAKASKEYGSKEKGQKVAAAAMWKTAAKK